MLDTVWIVPMTAHDGHNEYGVCTCRADVYCVHAGRTRDTLTPQMTFGALDVALVTDYALALLKIVPCVMIERMNDER